MKMKEKIVIHVDPLETLKHTRSAFANMKFGNCGPHECKKNYKRSREKQKIRKAIMDY